MKAVLLLQIITRRSIPVDFIVKTKDILLYQFSTVYNPDRISDFRCRLHRNRRISNVSSDFF